MTCFVRCPSCACAVKSGEPTCPHCGGPIEVGRQSKQWLATALVLGLGTGSCAAYGVAVTDGTDPGEGGGGCAQQGGADQGGGGEDCGEGGAGE
ncbi:MAG: hypothetical protein HOW73_45405 [Polyangiaceae bacterium]|nr:hypothetical protein [Polyangiaceae bacterium]